MDYDSKVILCCLYSLLFTVVATRNQCARFVFPTLNDTVVTAKEGDTITLPFSLQNNSCGEHGTFKILVSKRDVNITALTVCQITVVNDSCVSALSECSCLEGGAVSYQFTKSVNRSDDTIWQWQTTNEMATKKYITFNVSYPARVTNLTMSPINKTSSPFPMLSRVELVCTWEKGNPSQQVRLVDRHSKQLVPVTHAGSEIRYTFPGVRCRDAGVVGCEVPGADQNKTATLLVQCPPEFDESPRREFSVPPNTTTNIMIPVRTHSKTIKECTLTKIITPENETPKQSSGAGVTKDCKSFSFLTGTPPDLTLTVRLDNVRKEEEGQWQLELTNDVGPGHVDFLLRVNNDTDAAEVTGEGETTSSKAFVTSSSPLREANDATSLDWRIAGPIGAAVFIFVVAVVVSVTMITRRRGTVTTRRHRAPPKDRELAEVPAAAMLPVPSGIDKRLSSASHQYMEVEDAICPTKTS